ncbi:MAG: acyl carrier protein [Clostridiaceae bacterium]|nr:acyl carrier protein [Clostridiaceae bacterium]
MVFEKVKKLIGLQLGIGEDEIGEGTTFEDLGIDSLEIFEIIMALEDEFHIEIPNEDVESIKDIADITKYIQSKIE